MFIIELTCKRGDTRLKLRWFSAEVSGGFIGFFVRFNRGGGFVADFIIAEIVEVLGIVIGVDVYVSVLRVQT